MILACLYGAVAIAAAVVLVAALAYGSGLTALTSLITLILAASEVWEHLHE